MTGSLIINLDYTSRCRGTCPTCVLGTEERVAPENTLPAAKAVAAMEAIAALHPERLELLAIGIGRGNVLLLPEESINDLRAVGDAAERLYKADTITLEISTSMVGRLEDHIARAEMIREAFKGRHADPRFTVVVNAKLGSAPYYANIDRFLDHMAESRGGGDESGDILVLNLGSAWLPPLDWVEGFVSRFRSPVNLAWTPTFDEGLTETGALAKLSDWLIGFHAIARKHRLDSTLTSRLDAALARRQDDRAGIEAELAGSGEGLLYVDRSGKWHRGLFSLYGDMDPVRFDPSVATGADGSRRIMAEPAAEIAKLLAHRACRACPHLSPCLLSGAAKAGLMVRRRLPGVTGCPAAIRPLFEHIAAA